MANVINKKAYYFYIELALLVIIFALMYQYFPKSGETYSQSFQQENLRWLAYGSLRNLDELGILSTYINESLASSNFTALGIYIEQGLPDSIGADVELIINKTSCYSESILSSCGLSINAEEVSSALYTYSKRTEPLTIKLYVWRKYD
jgi:hypothetical protein